MIRLRRLDARHDYEIVGLLRSLADSGAAVLMTTSSMTALSDVDRAFTLGDAPARRGVCAEGERRRVSAEWSEAVAMLLVQDLCKHFPSPDGESIRAVDGVSFSIAAGELVALYGPSGSGKTTLLKIVAALMRPDAGSVSVGGREVTSLDRRAAGRYRLREVGFIRQEPSFVQGANALDNAALKLLDEMRRRDARKRVEPLLVRLGLGERLHHLPNQLSGGEQQRVLIARALSTDPHLLLADEPTGNLDTQRSQDVLGLLRELCHERGVATLLVTHDLQAAQYADRAVELRDGRLGEYVADGVTP